jgi:hypothetical protein
MTTTASYTTQSLLLTTGEKDYGPRKSVTVHRSDDGTILVQVETYHKSAAFFLSATEARALALTMMTATQTTEEN